MVRFALRANSLLILGEGRGLISFLILSKIVRLIITWWDFALMGLTFVLISLQLEYTPFATKLSPFLMGYYRYKPITSSQGTNQVTWLEKYRNTGRAYVKHGMCPEKCLSDAHLWSDSGKEANPETFRKTREKKKNSTQYVRLMSFLPFL